MKPAISFYFVTTDWDGPHSFETDGTFDAACEDYAEHTEAGRDVTVWRMDPAKGAAAPMCVDVTVDAITRVKHWHDAGERTRYTPYPEWLDGGDSLRQHAVWAAEDAAHERQEWWGR